MIYDTTKPSVPKMPNLGKGQNVVKSCLENVKNRARTPCFDVFSPTLRTFQRRGNSTLRPRLEGFDGQMANLVADSGPKWPILEKVLAHFLQ